MSTGIPFPTQDCFRRDCLQERRHHFHELRQRTINPSVNASPLGRIYQLVAKAHLTGGTSTDLCVYGAMRTRGRERTSADFPDGRLSTPHLIKTANTSGVGSWTCLHPFNFGYFAAPTWFAREQEYPFEIESEFPFRQVLRAYINFPRP